MKKAIKIITLIALLLTIVTIPSIVMSNTASAATSVKINKKKLTLEEGKTYNLKITGTNQPVKWSSSNKKVATVSSKGKVTAKSEGTATITATVNSKKYTCKITVKPALTEKETTKNIKYETIESYSNIIVILENKNKVDLCAEIEIQYLDDKGKLLYKALDNINTFLAGKKAVRTFTTSPYIADEDIEYKDIKVNISTILDYEWTKKSYIDELTIEPAKGKNELTRLVTNHSKDKIGTINIAALFYKKNTVVGASETGVYDLEPGSSQEVEFTVPFDSNYKEISYDRIEIIINEAYND